MSRSRRDLFPQYASGNITMVTAGVYATQGFEIGAMQGPTDRQFLVELIRFDCQPNFNPLATSDLTYDINLYKGADQTAVEGLNVGNTLAMIKWDSEFTTSGHASEQGPHSYNMQSADGFGILVPPGTFKIGYNSNVLTNINWRVYYRFVEATVEEYLGVVAQFTASS